MFRKRRGTELTLERLEKRQVPTAVILPETGINLGSKAPHGENSVSSLNTPANGVLTETILTSSTEVTAPGEAVSFTAEVFAAGGRAQGKVAFVVDGLTASVVTLTDGKATLTTKSLSVGTHTVEAFFTGDVQFLNSRSEPLSHSVVMPALATTTDLTLPPGLLAANRDVTLSATVSTAGEKVPTGEVVFNLDGEDVAHVALSDGRAEFTTKLGGFGTIPIVARFEGNDAFAASETSGTLTASDAMLMLESSEGSPIAGQPVTFTALVSLLPDTEAIPGSVTFFVDGVAVLTRTLDDGRVSYTAALSQGQHTVRAVYDGGSVFEEKADEVSLTVAPDPALFLTPTKRIEEPIVTQTVVAQPPVQTPTLPAAKPFVSQVQSLTQGVGGGRVSREESEETVVSKVKPAADELLEPKVQPESAQASPEKTPAEMRVPAVPETMTTAPIHCLALDALFVAIGNFNLDPRWGPIPTKLATEAMAMVAHTPASAYQTASETLLVTGAMLAMTVSLGEEKRYARK